MHDVAGMQVSHAACDICGRLQDRQVVDRIGGSGSSCSGVRTGAGGGDGGDGGYYCRMGGRAAVQQEHTRLQGVAEVSPIAELEDELHLRGGREGGREVEVDGGEGAGKAKAGGKAE